MKLGIIAGSGLEDLEELDGVELVISRHGQYHNISPSSVQYKNHMLAMQDKNVTHILALTACGSLREELCPGMFVLPDQVADRTYLRANTILHKVNHVSMANPFSEELVNIIEKSLLNLNLSYAKNKTLVTIEGPRFSTRAESNMYRQLGFDIINMTTMPEAIFAKELGIEYQPIAMVTDYDCWKDGEEVTFEKVKAVMKKNRKDAIALLTDIVKELK